MGHPVILNHHAVPRPDVIYYLYMPERLYQLRFDDQFKPDVPQDVTPEGFAGLEFDEGDREGRRGRFVREMREGVYVKSPGEAGHYLLERVYTPFEDFDQEEMWALLLDSKCQVTHEVMVYRGTVGALHIREAEVLKEAVRANAPALILSHCHPSGDPDPSPEDVQTTKMLRQAAGLLGIDLVDHVIVGRDAWISLRDRGMGFDSTSSRRERVTGWMSEESHPEP